MHNIVSGLNIKKGVRVKVRVPRFRSRPWMRDNRDALAYSRAMAQRNEDMFHVVVAMFKNIRTIIVNLFHPSRNRGMTYLKEYGCFPSG